MGSIKEVLMRRDNMTEEEAGELIEDARKDLQNRLLHPHKFGSPEEICTDHFGLEPDYIMELI